MLSRVAERMYWAGRYLERAENTARLVSTYSGLLLDLPKDSGVGWPELLRIVAGQDAFHAVHRKATEKNVLHFLLTDLDNPASILSSLALARENVRTSRDIVPREGWECINELYLTAQRDLHGAVGLRRRYQVLSDCVVRCQQITGLLSGTMSHGDAYVFLRMGNHIERADMTSRVVDVAAATLAEGNPSAAPYENDLWMAVLKSLSAYQMYRRHVRRRITGPDVVEFLLTDAQFPRAVAYTLDSLERCLRVVPRGDAPHQVLADLRQSVFREQQPPTDGAALHETIDRLQIGLATLHRAIAAGWFLETPNDEEDADVHVSRPED
ncbi:MAG: alpha-E domain-containing protein [Polyangiales bacterium]